MIYVLAKTHKHFKEWVAESDSHDQHKHLNTIEDLKGLTIYAYDRIVYLDGWRENWSWSHEFQHALDHAKQQGMMGGADVYVLARNLAQFNELGKPEYKYLQTTAQLTGLKFHEGVTLLYLNGWQVNPLYTIDFKQELLRRGATLDQPMPKHFDADKLKPSDQPIVIVSPQAINAAIRPWLNRTIVTGLRELSLAACQERDGQAVGQFLCLAATMFEDLTRELDNYVKGSAIPSSTSSSGVSQAQECSDDRQA